MPTKLLVLFTLLALIAFPACDKSSDGSADGDESTQEQSAGDDEDDSSDLPDEIAVEDFEDFAIDAACTAYDECRDEEIREAVALQFMFPVSVGIEMGMGRVDDKLRSDYQAVGRLLDEESTKRFGDDHCADFAEVAMRFFGWDVDSVERSIAEGHIEFDEKEAAACIQRIQDVPDRCSEEFELEQPLTFADVGRVVTQSDAELDAYLTGCEDVLIGQREEGQSCDFNHECVDGLNCVWNTPGGSGGGECTAPESGELKAPF